MPQAISLSRLALFWCRLSVLSFGGGPSVLESIRQEAVERRKWLTAEEFTREWTFCMAAPGINLFALALLLGRRVRGLPGALVSLAALALPAGLIAALFAAAAVRMGTSAPAQHFITGITAAAVGIGLSVAIKVVRPVLVTASREGALFEGALIAVAAAAAARGSSLPATLVGIAAINGVRCWTLSLRTRKPA